MRRGILGGSFDPVHNAHLRLAVEGLEQLNLDEVVLEVASVSPFKANEEPTDGETRFEMVCAAVADTAGLRAGRTDLGRPPPSYAVETLTAHAAEGRDLWFILGSDALRAFPQWREPDRILQLARLAVGQRPGGDPLDAVTPLPAGCRDHVDSFVMPLLEVSSSDIRSRVARGACIRHLTPDPVVKMIERERLYRRGA